MYEKKQSIKDKLECIVKMTWKQVKYYSNLNSD